jgi:hypothetical protein
MGFGSMLIATDAVKQPVNIKRANATATSLTRLATSIPRFFLLMIILIFLFALW